MTRILLALVVLATLATEASAQSTTIVLQQHRPEHWPRDDERQHHDVPRQRWANDPPRGHERKHDHEL